MSQPPRKHLVTIAVIGNPNTGKSTLFNALCGVRQRVGNYPGVTVERKIGRAEINGRHFSMIDLPGSYSLAPRSPDEMIAVDVLLGRRRDVQPPDAVLCIVDASNIERNLYLVSQVLELGLPTVLALNMIDVARDKGLTIDAGKLRQRLGIPVVVTQANKRRGLAELRLALAEAVEGSPQPRPSPFPEEFQREVAVVEAKSGGNGQAKLPRYLAERLLLDTTGYLAHSGLPGVNDGILHEVEAARARLAEAGYRVPGVEAIARYGWVGEVTADVIARPSERSDTLTDRVDRVLTHKVWGSLVFVLVMMLLFQSVFWMAEPASNSIDAAKGIAGDFVAARLAEGALESLVVNGVIEGVGSVLVFLPQIFVLFLFIAVLEDCGYMARAAYLMDKLMSRIGLSGKSFIPLLSSFACAIPGIMSARVIENPRDRLVTILVAPLMSCSARLPVYTLLIGAFIPQTSYLGGLLGLQGVTMFAMYGVGVMAAVLVALALRRTILHGPVPPFVMELPSYKVPGLGLVLYRMCERGWAFVRRAGTLIFAVAIVVWAAAYYPRNPTGVDATLLARRGSLATRVSELQRPSNGTADAETERTDGELIRLQNELAAVKNEIKGEYLRQSFLGRVGRFVEPAVQPLGWDWRIGCAAVASFPAREVVIATLSVIYHLGEEENERSQTLRDTLRGATWEGTERPVFTVPVALSLMVFFALCAQCAPTLAVIRRETNRWRWPIFTFLYMTTLAYVAAMVTYQVGTLLAR